MPLDKRIIAELATSFGFEKLGFPIDDFSTMVAEALGSKLPQPSFPEAHESLAVTLSTQKIAALAHDRVLSLHPFGADLPKEIGFNCSTPPEELIHYSFLLRRVAKKYDLLPEQQEMSTVELATAFNLFMRLVSTDIAKSTSTTPVIYFESTVDYNKEFTTGPQRVLTAAIENVAMVDEDALTWEQVLEFRKDTEARAKYRRFVRWIDNELKTKSPAEVQDLIAIRLDDYEWGLKKHGMKTALGSLSCVMDPKFLASAAAVVGASTLAGGELWAALSSATLAVGGAVVSFGKSYIDSLDERRKDNYEVAYIHDIKKLAK